MFTHPLYFKIYSVRNFVMKSRIITGLVGLVVVIGWLFSMYTPVFAAVLAIVAAIGVFETLKAFEIRNPVFKGICIVISALVPFYFEYKSKISVPLFPVITASPGNIRRRWSTVARSIWISVQTVHHIM